MCEDYDLWLRLTSKLEVGYLEDGKIWISMIYPAQNTDIVKRLQETKATAFALDQIPRLLSRGQAYDVLSSQSNVAGYRAVIETANEINLFHLKLYKGL